MSAFKSYFNANGIEQVDETGDLSAAFSKLEEYAARLALIVHYLRWAAGDVTDELLLDVDSMNAGIALATWFKGEARRVYAMLDESDVDRDQRRLIEWIVRKNRPVSAREVQQHCRWLREPGKAKDALDKLVAAGLGTWQELPTTAMGGAPSKVFTLFTSTKPPDSKPESGVS
jgi:hypothetical protein